jgi:Type I phosphodiesterase / nucleotide pyrophosphatase
MDLYAEIPPRYADGWLGDVMPSVLGVLGIPGMRDPFAMADRLAGVRQVAVMMIDGLGWHQLHAGVPLPTLSTLVVESSGPITCGFPSTTPTSLVSFGTGARSGSHGVLAFTSNVPGTDRVLNHTLWLDDPDPVEWQPVPLLFHRAHSAGVSTAVVNRTMFAGSGLTLVSTGEAGYRPVEDSIQGVDRVLEALNDGVRLVYGYLPEVDRAGHEFGAGNPSDPGSQEWRAAMIGADTAIERLLNGMPHGSALVITADHGHMVSPWDRRIDLDTVPELSAGLRVVAGEPRVRYLHTVDGAEDDVLAAWRELAGHAAWIGTREEAVATGWYGPVPDKHAERLGDVVVICRDDWSIQATSHEPPSIAKLIGLHGARTRLEMEIPLLIARV